MNKAVFLDRDGVINDNTKFVNTVGDIRYNTGVFEFARDAIEKGYKIFVVTNQGGVAAGHISFVECERIKQYVLSAFRLKQCPITEYFTCMHLPPTHKSVIEGDKTKMVERLIIDCDCRKPKPGMILQAAEKYKIDLLSSIMIGDNQTDIDAAIAAGIENTFLFNQKENIWPNLQ